MTDDELEYVRDCIDNEGFSYCFLYYSKFEELDDPEFHRLRKAYIKATEELKEYIGEGN